MLYYLRVTWVYSNKGNAIQNLLVTVITGLWPRKLKNEILRSNDNDYSGMISISVSILKSFNYD